MGLDGFQDIVGDVEFPQVQSAQLGQGLLYDLPLNRQPAQTLLVRPLVRAAVLPRCKRLGEAITIEALHVAVDPSEA